MKRCFALLLTAAMLFSLGCEAFAQTLNLPASIKRIEDEAFYGDESLDEVVIPYGTTSIGARAFAYSGVKRIYLPETVSEIGDDAFAGVEGLTILSAEDSYAAEYAELHELAWEDDNYYYSNLWLSEQMSLLDSLAGLESIVPEEMDFTLKSTEGVTDPAALELIEKYNEIQLDLEELYDDYMEGLSELVEGLMPLADSLAAANVSVDDDALAYADENLSFSVPLELADQIGDDFAIGEGTLLEDGSFQLTYTSGGQSFALQTNIDGISLVTAGENTEVQSAGLFVAVSEAAFSGLISALSPIRDAASGAASILTLRLNSFKAELAKKEANKKEREDELRKKGIDAFESDDEWNEFNKKVALLTAKVKELEEAGAAIREAGMYLSRVMSEINQYLKDFQDLNHILEHKHPTAMDKAYNPDEERLGKASRINDRVRDARNALIWTGANAALNAIVCVRIVLEEALKVMFGGDIDSNSTINDILEETGLAKGIVSSFVELLSWNAMYSREGTKKLVKDVKKDDEYLDNWPNTDFWKWARDNLDTNGDRFLSQEELDAVTTIDCTGKGLSNLGGIEFFENLESLTCANNNLTSLTLPENKKLKTLNCTGNPLTALDLKGFPALYNLTARYCTELTELDCTDSGLLMLDVWGCTALKELRVSGCKSLLLLNVNGSPSLNTLDVQGCTALTDLYASGCDALTALDVSGLTALKIVDAKNSAALTELDANGCTALTELYVSGCAALKKLDCTKSSLQMLDASGLAALEELYVQGTQLTGLIVRDCTALTNLNLMNLESLTYVDAHGCAKLEQLRFQDSPANNHVTSLTRLDISGCTALTSLFFPEFGSLTYLYVNDCTSLEQLIVNNNRLIALHASGCTNLNELQCAYNQLTSLDVSGCTNLNVLRCAYNQLTSLDVSGCTNLEELLCFDNQLTSLNVSGCTKMYYLNCSNNQLTSLDASDLWTHPDIDPASHFRINCDHNRLTSLNLPKCYVINCGYVINGVGNGIITCKYNNLTTVDITGTFCEVETDVADHTQAIYHCSYSPQLHVDVGVKIVFREIVRYYAAYYEEYDIKYYLMKTVIYTREHICQDGDLYFGGDFEQWRNGKKVMFAQLEGLAY